VLVIEYVGAMKTFITVGFLKRVLADKPDDFHIVLAPVTPDEPVPTINEINCVDTLRERKNHRPGLVILRYLSAIPAKDFEG
jgi:hypothetical protein